MIIHDVRGRGRGERGGVPAGVAGLLEPGLDEDIIDPSPIAFALS